MRVRYQMAGEAEVAKCDLSEKKARKLFSELDKNGTCMWAELVGEEDDNYMYVLESFERINEARKLKAMLDSIARCFK